MKKTVTALGLAASLLTGYAYADSAVPPLNHVFVIMMENRAYDQVIGNDDAPFINEWAQTANLATNYFGVGHPSLTNYLELVGGSNFGITNDNAPDWHGATPMPNLNEPISGTGTDVETPAAIAPFNIDIPATTYVGKTIADQLVEAHKSWKSYQESLPDTGADNVNYSDGDFSNLSNLSNVVALYAVKHNPFVYFANVQEGANPVNSLHNTVGFDGLNGLYADLRSGKVPSLSFIAPNQCHDMHGVGNGTAFCTYSTSTLAQMSDAALKKIVTAIKASPAWKHGNNAIVAVWDENDFGPEPNQVVAIVDTNYGVHGVSSNAPYSHFSMLKTLEAGFGLPCLNHACDANITVMKDMFQGKRDSYRHHDDN